MRRLTTFHEGFLPEIGELLVLGKESGHHLVKVLRAREGAKIMLFNDKGEWGWGVLKVDHNRIGLEMIEKATIPKPAVEKMLIQALPKGRGIETILREATEIGVTKILPVITARTEVEMNTEKGAKKMERWRSIIIEACKQSGNVVIPKIEEVRPFKELAKYLGEKKAAGEVRLVASLEEDAQLLKNYIHPQVTQVVWAIGPEGDFAPEEYSDLGKWGFSPVLLTKNILRVETAALYALSIMDYELQKVTKAAE